MNNKVLILGGGFPQAELIRNLKHRGYETILIDYLEFPIAKKIADKHYQISTLDIIKVEEIALREKITFVLTCCTDQALLTMAKVSKDLNLPCYLSYDIAKNVTNKVNMKQIFKNNSILSSNYIIVNELYSSNININFPLIIKPADCNSSKGVRKLYNTDELEKYFWDAKNMSRSGNVIIEEFIDGKELTVDAWVTNGKSLITTISISEKIKADNKFVIYRTLNQAIINKELKDKLEVTVQKIVNAFNLKNCPMLIQFIVNNGNPYVIEFSARTGGGVKHLLIKEQSGVDVIDSLIDLTIGNPLRITTKESGNYLINEFIYCNDGIYDHAEGFDVLLKEGYISNYYIFKTRNSIMKGITNSGDRIAGFTIIGKTIDELVSKHNHIKHSFKIIDQTGVDIAKHDLLLDFTKDNFVV